MIPLSADKVQSMWQRIRPHEFRITHGGFAGMDVEESSCAAMKERVYHSMKTQIVAMGGSGHEMLGEER